MRGGRQSDRLLCSVLVASEGLALQARSILFGTVEPGAGQGLSVQNGPEHVDSRPGVRARIVAAAQEERPEDQGPNEPPSTSVHAWREKLALRAESGGIMKIVPAILACLLLACSAVGRMPVEKKQVPQTQPDGYLAVPPTGKGSAVLVLHAWWGLNDTTRAFCRRLAESGFVAFAPDLYRGKVADNIADAGTLSKALGANQSRAKADIAEAVRFLTERAGQADRGLAVVGFSMGAYYALDLSATDSNIHSVVVFYGTRDGDYGSSKAAYLGHFAETDEFEPQSGVDRLEAALRRAGRPVNFYSYPGTGHWFFEPDRAEAFNRAAANLAWDRTLAFLLAPKPRRQ